MIEWLLVLSAPFLATAITGVLPVVVLQHIRRPWVLAFYYVAWVPFVLAAWALWGSRWS